MSTADEEVAPTGNDAAAPTPHVDRGALLGAALAAVIALTFGGQGEWDWLAVCAGVALLAVLGAFFRLPTGPRHPAMLAEIAAMSAVAALAAALVVAAPLQAALSEFSADGRGCRASAAVAAGVVLIDEQQQRGAELAVDRLAAEGRAATPGEALLQAADHEHQIVLGVCLGAVTSRWLWLPAAVIGTMIFIGAALRLRRTTERH